MIPWWERYPEIYAREVEALRRCGITLLAEGKDSGQLFFELNVPLSEGTSMAVVAGYPDMFPYMRPEVVPKDRAFSLPRHQHPFGKNFCLIGPSTANWDVDDTLAELLRDQFPKLLQFQTRDADTLRELEDPIGESIANYYDYDKDACIFIDSGWKLDPEITSGKLRLAYAALRPLRGAILGIYDSAENALVTADPSLASTYEKSVWGRWVRWPHAISLNDPKGILETIKRKYPAAVAGGERRRSQVDRPDVLGLVFRDEIQQGVYADNWIFIAQGKAPRFVRASRAGRRDLASRVPELESIGTKCVAFIGLGSLGAPSALEFAKAGLGTMKLADHDLVEAGTVVRWPFGLQAVAREKVVVLRDFVESNYPYTRVEIFPGMIGSAFRSPRYSDARDLEKLIEADLVFDATAEVGIQHLLSDLAAERRTPYVCVSTTPGGWGGLVYRQRADASQGCWSCLQRYLEEGTVIIPNDKPDGMLQPAGCGSATFTGTGFDANLIGLMAVRLAVSTLCRGQPGGYPDVAWDCAVVNLRSSEGEVLPPRWKTFRVPPHKNCRNVFAHRSSRTPATQAP
jgi:molybdopterin/thiamine biosynthesis adenylyltransferase